MKILVYRWKSYTYQDTIEILKSMGHQVEEISNKLMNYEVDEEFAELLYQKLTNDRFDLVYTSNYFGLISDICEDLGIIYVAWSCDNPLISMYHKSVYNSCNRIFLFDLSSVREFKSMGVENVWHLPLSVNVRRLDNVIRSAGLNEGYDHEVAFVGSLYERNTYDKIKYSMPEYLQGYFEAMMSVQKDLFGVSVIEGMFTPDIIERVEEFYQLEKSKDSMSDLELIFSTTVLGFKIAQLARVSILNKLSESVKVDLFTGSDSKDIPKAIVHKEIDYWKEMPIIFNRSKINLNITIPNIKTGVSLRCFDVMGAGGFLLSNFQSEMPLLFKEGEEMVVFYDEKDLCEKVKWYLEHDEIRRQIAMAGKRRVETDYTYEKQLEFIFSKL